MRALTLERTKAIYRTAVDPKASDAEGDAWWAQVQAELDQVLSASKVGEAADVIAWWHNDWRMVGDPPRAAAGRLRAAARSH